MMRKTFFNSWGGKLRKGYQGLPLELLLSPPAPARVTKDEKSVQGRILGKVLDLTVFKVSVPHRVTYVANLRSTFFGSLGLFLTQVKSAEILLGRKFKIIS